jgi:hypothetical protein
MTTPPPPPPPTILDIRNALKNALSGKFSVYNSVPEIITPPCVVLLADNPYLEPNYIGSTVRLTLRLKAVVMVAMLDNESAQDNIEKALIEIYQTIPNNWIIGSASRPSPTTVGIADYLTAEIDLATVFTA